MSNSKREIKIEWALLPPVFMIVSMFGAVYFLELEPQIPLVIGTAIAALVAYKHGFS